MEVKKKIIQYLAIATKVAISLVIALPLYFIYTPVEKSDISSIEVIIESGDGLNIVAGKLANADLVRSELLLISYVKLHGWEDELKAGRYIFSRSFNIPTLVSMIIGGQSETDDLVTTIPEGFNVWEIDERLTAAELIVEGEFTSKYYNDEGYLYPDTYRVRNFQFSNSNFQISTNDQNSKPQINHTDFIEELREKMAESFRNKTADLLKGLSLAETREVIVIASILEKEARAESDMKLVSGIIRNRLKLGIPLQVDATVIYGACLRNYQLSITNNQSKKNCNVTFQGPAKEIKIDGTFNTYTRNGLPPTPISNPGLRAINASLNPQESDYLYYLSTRDGSQMIYSKTPTEHAVNRRKYLGI